MITETLESIKASGFDYRKLVETEDKLQTTREIRLRAAKAGTLTTRTNDTQGRVTFPSANHGITTGARIDIYWQGGHRRGVTVGTVESGATWAPFSGGTGDNLPSTSTALTVAIPEIRNFRLEGYRAGAFIISVPRKSIILFTNNSLVEQWQRIFSADDGDIWWYRKGQGADPNPIEEMTFRKIVLSQGSLQDVDVIIHIGLDDLSASAIPTDAYVDDSGTPYADSNGIIYVGV